MKMIHDTKKSQRTRFRENRWERRLQERLRIFLAKRRFSELYPCNAKIIFEAIVVITRAVVKDVTGESSRPEAISLFSRQTGLLLVHLILFRVPYYRLKSFDPVVMQYRKGRFRDFMEDPADLGKNIF
jgi:hypothetical protein